NSGGTRPPNALPGSRSRERLLIDRDYGSPREVAQTRKSQSWGRHGSHIKHGAIGVESRPDHGACVIVELALADEPVATRGRAPASGAETEAGGAGAPAAVSAA